jgi:hypothetical protein
MWKALIFTSLAASALFIFELALMWSLLREEGVQQVFNRRFDGGLQIAREVAVFTISLFWVVSKISASSTDSSGAMLDRESHFPGTAAGMSLQGVENEAVITNEESDLFEDSVFDDSVNPANGLPMIGSLDIEGNVYGTDSVHDCSGGFDDDISMGLSDSLFDDDLSSSDDDWI